MKHLIINADDFGLTAGVNRGITDAHVRGIVTSASLLANGDAFEDAVALARKSAGLGIGVHLNLTQGRPAAPISKVRSLVNSDGRFGLSPYRLGLGILSGRVRLLEIETEMRAQIDKIVSAGISPTHLDGHKHVHVLPGISKVVIRLAQEFCIPAIRTPLDELPSLGQLLKVNHSAGLSIFKQALVARGACFLALQLKQRAMKVGLTSPARFYGLAQTGFLDLLTLRNILSSLPEGTSELMCHPGHLDHELRIAGTRLLAQREVEMKALTSFEIRELVQSQNIRLISYRDLAEVTNARANAA